MSGRRESFLASALMNYGTSLTASVLSLGNVLIVARGLDATSRGQIAFLTTIAMLTSALAAIGIPQASSNFAGKRPELTRTLAGNAVVAALITGGIGIAIVSLLVVAVPDIGGQDIPTHLRWAALATIPILILGMSLQAITVAHYGFRAMNTAWLVTPVLTVTANGAMLAAGELSVGRALGSWCVGQTLSTLILGWYVWRRLDGFGRPDAGLGRREVKFGVQAHAGRVLNQGNYRLDQWIMGSIAGSEALGIYSIAVAWTEALFFLPASVALAQLPDVTRAGPKDAARQASGAFRVAALVTAVLAVGMIVFAPVLATGVFGEEFAPATNMIRVLALGAFGIVALKLLGTTLTAQGRPLLETVGSAATFIVVVGLDLALIPAHQGMGASVASLAGYSFGGLVVAVIFCRTLDARLRDLVPRGGEIAAARALLRRMRRRGRTREVPAA